MRTEGVHANQLELQAASDYYRVDINVFSVEKGAGRPFMVFKTVDTIEYLPISLWQVSEKHYNVFTEIPELKARIGFENN
jgi:hypothetical protein